MTRHDGGQNSLHNVLLGVSLIDDMNHLHGRLEGPSNTLTFAISFSNTWPEYVIFFIKIDVYFFRMLEQAIKVDGNI